MFWLIYITMNIENVLLWLECSSGQDRSESKKKSVLVLQV